MQLIYRGILTILATLLIGASFKTREYWLFSALLTAMAMDLIHSARGKPFINLKAVLWFFYRWWLDGKPTLPKREPTKRARPLWRSM